jgi:hypothetical protein
LNSGPHTCEAGAQSEHCIVWSIMVLFPGSRSLPPSFCLFLKPLTLSIDCNLVHHRGSQLMILGFSEASPPPNLCPCFFAHIILLI